MTLLSDLRDGWQMFLPYAEEVISPRRRVALLTLPPVLSVGVAAVFRLVGWRGVPSGLIALARTTPPIETAPEVPSDYHADGRKIEKPYKLLGTDNPADYT